MQNSFLALFLTPNVLRGVRTLRNFPPDARELQRGPIRHDQYAGSTRHILNNRRAFVIREYGKKFCHRRRSV